MNPFLTLLVAFVLAVAGWMVGGMLSEGVGWSIVSSAIGAVAGLLLTGGFFFGAVLGWLAKLKADEDQDQVESS